LGGASAEVWQAREINTSEHIQLYRFFILDNLRFYTAPATLRAGDDLIKESTIPPRRTVFLAGTRTLTTEAGHFLGNLFSGYGNVFFLFSKKYKKRKNNEMPNLTHNHLSKFKLAT
jgi:hypothetical protein